MGLVKFNDISTDDLGLIVQFTPTYRYPEKEYETTHIPGRNGDLVVDRGSFKNVERTYSLAKVFKQGENFATSANSIASWLHSASGYARLEDSYEPEYYRMAMYKSDGEMNNFYDMATALEVTFECKPQRWLKSGEKETSVANGSKLRNPTKFDSLPTIIFNTVAGEQTTIGFEVGEEIISITLDSLSNTDSIRVTLDCENMECYSGNTLYNTKLTLNSGVFPVLKANSETLINIDNATNVCIIPRWWTL